MRVEPWQIPVLGMALLSLPPSVHYLVQRARGTASGNDRRPDRPEEPGPQEKQRREWLRTAIFVVATVVLTAVFIVALGTDLADVVTSVAAGIVTVIAAANAVRSGQNLRKQTGHADPPPAGTETPARPG
jgi:hypothetical protein